MELIVLLEEVTVGHYLIHFIYNFMDMFEAIIVVVEVQVLTIYYIIIITLK